MASKHMKRDEYNSSLGKCGIKTSGNHFIPIIRIAVIKTWNSIDAGLEKLESRCIADGNVK